MRDPIHIDASRGDVRGDEDTDRAGFEILQRTEPLVLRAIGMDSARLNSAAFQTASDMTLKKHTKSKIEKPRGHHTSGQPQRD
jgi:hypothetical protein